MTRAARSENAALQRRTGRPALRLGAVARLHPGEFNDEMVGAVTARLKGSGGQPAAFTQSEEGF